jgi:phosphopantetheinyl transferase
VDLGALTRSERWEYDRLPRDHEARRRDWLAGRCAGKRAVAARCGVPIERLQMTSRVDAAPRCSVLDGDCWKQLPVSVSIAHCDGVAIAAAAASSTRVGVDIERVGEIAPEHLRYFVAPSEGCTDASLAWVLKEAAWKALGLGPAVPFTAVQLSFDSDARTLQGVRIESTWISARADVLRFSRQRPLVAAVLEIGDVGDTGRAGENTRSRQELS